MGFLVEREGDLDGSAPKLGVLDELLFSKVKVLEM